jgi:quercetin dioxygenase-like cupin family protein
MEKDRDQLDGLAGETFDVTGLLSYQEGAIVSRTLVDTEAATVTVFALDEGQTISEHTAPHDAIMQVLDGTATVTIGDDRYTVEAGEGLVFPAEEPHALDAEQSFKMLLTMIR